MLQHNWSPLCTVCLDLSGESLSSQVSESISPTDLKFVLAQSRKLMAVAW